MWERQLFLRLAHKFIAIACKICYYKYVYIRTGVQSVNSGAGLPANICEKVIELSFPQDKIRNFSIIAHIDHGKSTLADRILEQTNSVSARDMESQLLDDMELERERGITIKARAVSVTYDADDGEKYLFNLIDTPGHVDFNYEVSRSLAACEGAVLIVDASQGIEAQTLANTYLAVDSGLEIVPVINKIDLPSADPDRVIEEIEDVIGIPAEDAPKISAKQGINIHAVLEKIVSDIPAPTGDVNAPLRALIFDSYYDSYKGVIIYVRLKEGQIHPGDEFKLMATGSTFTVVECGLMHATSMESTNGLYAGEVGYIAASIKTLADAKSATLLLLPQILRQSRCRVIVRHSQWFTAVFILLTVQNTVILKMLLKNYSLMTQHSLLNPKHLLHSALAIAADSSDFFIWRLFKKDLSVNISLTLSQLHRA